MIKIVLSAAWVCMIIAVSLYGTVAWKSNQADLRDTEEMFGGLDYVKAPTISVPVIGDGKVTGYVVAEFVYTAEAKLLKQLSVPVDPFLTDEAFRIIYSGEAVEFTNLKKYDLDGLRTKIAQNVNVRFGSKIVKDVLVEQFNYVPMSQIRFGPKRKKK